MYLFPNPATGIIRVRRSPEVKHFPITIQDSKSKNVDERSGEETIGLRRNSPGICFILIRTEGWIIRQKIVKLTAGN